MSEETIGALTEKKKTMNLSPAMKVVTKTLTDDPSYRHGWVANIAMQFQDECRRYKKKHKKTTLSKDDIHKISNAAAEEFIAVLCKDQKG